MSKVTAEYLSRQQFEETVTAIFEDAAVRKEAIERCNATLFDRWDARFGPSTGWELRGNYRHAIDRIGDLMSDLERFIRPKPRWRDVIFNIRAWISWFTLRHVSKDELAAFKKTVEDLQYTFRACTMYLDSDLLSDLQLAPSTWFGPHLNGK